MGAANVIAQVVSAVAGGVSARESYIANKKQGRAVKRARGQQNEKRAKLESEKKAKAQKEETRLQRDKQKQAKVARGLSSQGRKGTILTGPLGQDGQSKPAGQQSGPETKTLLGL